jgi:hypothetical protein
VADRLTDPHDAFVADVFGVNPAHYATPQAAAGGTADTSPAAPAPAGPQAPAAGGAPANKETIEKSRTAWVATRKHIEGELNKLKKGVAAALKGHAGPEEVEKTFTDKVFPILDSLDEKLSDKLAELGRAKDGQEHTKLVGEVHKIIAKYRQFMTGEPVMKMLDDNPFVPVSVEKTLTATLAALEKSIH